MLYFPHGMAWIFMSSITYLENLYFGLKRQEQRRRKKVKIITGSIDYRMFSLSYKKYVNLDPEIAVNMDTI